jgi:hypothetical protein
MQQSKGLIIATAFKDYLVDLSNKGLTDNNVNEICNKMKTNTAIQCLNLSGNKFTDEKV